MYCFTKEDNKMKSLIKPNNVILAAEYLLKLDSAAVEEIYRAKWKCHLQRLRELLEIFYNPAHRLPKETFIDYWDRSLKALFEITNLLVLCLTKTTRQQLALYLREMAAISVSIPPQPALLDYI